MTNERTEHIACAGKRTAAYRALVADLRDRTETAMGQSHCFAVCRLALMAEDRALGRA